MESYKVIKHIGSGSFGSVYLTQTQNGDKFALKKIHIDPFTTQKSLREIELMKLTHPNLVRVYHYHLDQTIDQLQIIMEYCQEGDLMNYFHKVKKITTEEILNIFRQIFKAFILMNAKGIVHRDLKPQNILISKGNIIKVGDFGCARSIEQMQMSQVKSFSLDIGTFLYASPQQLNNQKYSVKCDVWAAGCIAYLLEFGTHPFLDSKPHNTLLNIKQRTKGKFIQLQPTIDPTINQLISLCLIYDDQERASWREIWLSRVFAQKIMDVKKFLDYLKYLSSIASWITKQFWKIRKDYNISKYSDQIFAYFIIKFQYTNLKMALKILKKSPNYRYLFEQQTFKNYFPNEQQFHQIKKSYLQHEKYFLSIKKTMQSKKESFVQIALRQPLRKSSFSDLQKSIRACYKILTEVLTLNKDNPKGLDNKIWVVLSYWINFQTWFSYEKQPRLEKMLSQIHVHDVTGIIMKELGKYQMGVVE